MPPRAFAGTGSGRKFPGISWWLACCLLSAPSISCTTHRPAPSQADIEPTSATGARLSVLANAVSRTRTALDSVILEMHRTSGNTSAGGLARSRQLRSTAASLGSTYRVNLAEFLSTANAAAAGATEPTARFPVNSAPAPLLRGFVDGKYWMLQSPMVHEIGRNSPYVVIVPRGFVTDLTSIPQPLQLLGIQPNGCAPCAPSRARSFGCSSLSARLPTR